MHAARCLEVRTSRGGAPPPSSTCDGMGWDGMGWDGMGWVRRGERTAAVESGGEERRAQMAWESAWESAWRWCVSGGGWGPMEVSVWVVGSHGGCGPCGGVTARAAACLAQCGRKRHASLPSTCVTASRRRSGATGAGQDRQYIAGPCARLRRRLKGARAASPPATWHQGGVRWGVRGWGPMG
jgi:hypothetical protein